ncbi:MAG TPA: cytochrome c oxidase subunit 3 family protein [Terriglobales bacterium]|nr:cytochrome c oxidase subunit 3 family protein [Terriglobales bacterium]
MDPRSEQQIALEPHHADAPHHPRQFHHFDTMEQQYQSSSLGMWVFLIQEIMFFGGLFVAYLVYRHKYYEAFGIASATLRIDLGAFNTAVLIGSSLTMALAVNAAQRGLRKRLMTFIVLTMILGSIFLGVKVVEYTEKFEKREIPGKNFCFEPQGAACTNVSHAPESTPAILQRYATGHFFEASHAAAPHEAEATHGSGTTAESTHAESVEPQYRVRDAIGDVPGSSERDRSKPGAEIYFSLYFAMTGMHAIHMIVGMGLMAWLLFHAYRGRYSQTYFTPIENFGLYWHFVDIVWIYLFPLLYLINRHIGAH